MPDIEKDLKTIKEFTAKHPPLDKASSPDDVADKTKGYTTQLLVPNGRGGFREPAKDEMVSYDPQRQQYKLTSRDGKESIVVSAAAHDKYREERRKLAAVEVTTTPKAVVEGLPPVAVTTLATGAEGPDTTTLARTQPSFVQQLDGLAEHVTAALGVNPEVNAMLRGSYANPDANPALRPTSPRQVAVVAPAQDMGGGRS